jgi:hypothetical protein
MSEIQWGGMQIRYSDREETITAGQAYCLEPGHIPHITEPTESVEFTQIEEMRKTMEVMQRNMEAAKKAHEVRG